MQVRGSAPWVRGTHMTLSQRLIKRRFSPVGTGNTTSTQVDKWSAAVQPRGYGEHSALLSLIVKTRGSAPWVRGTL